MLCIVHIQSYFQFSQPQTHKLPVLEGGMRIEALVSVLAAMGVPYPLHRREICSQVMTYG